MKVTNDGLWNVIGGKFLFRRGDFPLDMIRKAMQRIKARIARIEKIDYARTYFTGEFKINFAGKFILIIAVK